MTDIESYQEFKNRVSKLKSARFPLPTRTQSEKRSEGNGIEIPPELAAELELTKAKRIVEFYESKKQVEIDDDGGFDENDLGIYAAPPLHVQIFPDAELNDDFDEVEEAETIGNESNAFEDIDEIDETDFY